ncbi:hypothetical protein C1645_785617 [Glomus cerebriforme]|uniref:Ubiquitin-like protease family profile domain-containing protein n=1 Tax=Glomus cerebriforme TaxID=658196 RepID=A0A397SIA9_9GLOM|nr:hypothetical protein C1645_785617 [Glomus cerebriforme]
MEVIDLLKRNNDNDTNVIYINSESISAEKLYELCDRDIWLSSDHINAYLSYLNTKFHSIFSLPSFFYTKLTTTGRYDYSSVVRWTKKTEIFNKEIIFVPINLDETHWILATIFMKDEYRIAVLDSLGILTNDNAIAIGRHLIRWLNDEYCHKFRVYDNNEYENPDLNESIRKSTIFGDAEEISFTFDIMFREKPPQVDGCSCGVFVCMFARLIAENVERDTIMEIAKWQEAILKFRKVMCTDLWEYAKANGQVDKVKIVDNIFSP